MNLVLIGFKASGKSAVGRGLAKELGMRFVDLDDLIEEIYEKEHGKKSSFREIYANHGKKFFRELENQAGEEAALLDNCIIATGGGTMIFFKNHKLLKERSKIIYLIEEPKAMLGRIRARGIPAFLNPEDLEGSMNRELEKRKPVYEKAADYKFDIRGMMLQEIPGKLISFLKDEGVL
ncbi:MAG: shikimate kinase [archaeon]|jgi:shikimate kinase|nr:shikimate kinase [archaeon]